MLGERINFKWDLNNFLLILNRDIPEESEQRCALTKSPSTKQFFIVEMMVILPSTIILSWDIFSQNILWYFKTFNCVISSLTKWYQRTIFLTYLCSFLPHRHSMQDKISRVDRWCSTSYGICQSVFVTMHSVMPYTWRIHIILAKFFKASSQEKNLLQLRERDREREKKLKSSYELWSR